MEKYNRWSDATGIHPFVNSSKNSLSYFQYLLFPLALLRFLFFFLFILAWLCTDLIGCLFVNILIFKNQHAIYIHIILYRFPLEKEYIGIIVDSLNLYGRFVFYSL